MDFLLAASRTLVNVFIAFRTANYATPIVTTFPRIFGFGISYRTAGVGPGQPLSATAGGDLFRFFHFNSLQSKSYSGKAANPSITSSSSSR
jgi:hypothetical protein